MENSPSRLVETPREVPFITTEAPITGSPSSVEVTTPVTGVCAIEGRAIRKLRKKKYNFFMVYYFILLQQLDWHLYFLINTSRKYYEIGLYKVFFTVN
jgi:hypothetical protein